VHGLAADTSLAAADAAAAARRLFPVVLQLHSYAWTYPCAVPSTSYSCVGLLLALASMH
jgi:hypothetical protein